jgi:hypothetical protein
MDLQCDLLAPQPEDEPDLERLRHAVTELVIAIGTRAAGKELGLSSSRVHTFVSGQALGQQSLAAVQAWYADRVARGDVPGEEPAPDGPDVETLRAALRETVARTSIRAAADEVGVPKSLIEVFLRPDNKPHERTLRVFRRWYAESIRRYK